MHAIVEVKIFMLKENNESGRENLCRNLGGSMVYDDKHATRLDEGSNAETQQYV